MMSTWAYFLWLSRLAAVGLFFMWPITAGLFCLLAVGALRSRGTPLATLRGGWWLQVVPLVIPIAVLGLGAVYACENCSPSALGQGVRHVWAGYIVNALLLVQLIGALWLIRIASGRRIVSAALQAIGVWCTFWASFLAGMSISGDWL
jgi:hypothetical protein